MTVGTLREILRRLSLHILYAELDEQAREEYGNTALFGEGIIRAENANREINVKECIVPNDKRGRILQ